MLYLFIIINNNIFRKVYFGEIFYKFLKTNESIIKEYFGRNIKYEELYNSFYKMDVEQEEKAKNELTLILIYSVFKSSKIILSIIIIN